MFLESLAALREEPARFIIGITAGASAMGIDTALVRIKRFGIEAQVKLVEHRSIPYHAGLRNRLLANRQVVREAGLLHEELGAQMAAAAKELQALAEAQGTPAQLVAAQGFPIAHTPRRGGAAILGTLNLGDPAVLAQATGLPVIDEFTARDVAEGGQGFPWTALADWMLFRRENRTIAVLHLGASVRLTLVPPEAGGVRSFEVGPCNRLIDGALRHMLKGNRQFDKDGSAAAKGQVIEDLCDKVLDHPYFGRVPPKSLAVTDFSAEGWLREVLDEWADCSTDDRLASMCAAIAASVARAFDRFVDLPAGPERIVLTGGGVANAALRKALKRALPGVVLRKSGSYGLPAEAVDPVRVAVLANETLFGRPGNLPSATGARGPAVLGRITPA